MKNVHVKGTSQLRAHNLGQSRTEDIQEVATKQTAIQTAKPTDITTETGLL